MKVGKFGIKGPDKSAITTEKSLQLLSLYIRMCGRLTFRVVFLSLQKQHHGFFES